LSTTGAWNAEPAMSCVTAAPLPDGAIPVADLAYRIV